MIWARGGPAGRSLLVGAGPVLVASEVFPEPNAVSRSTTRQTHATTASAAVRRALRTLAHRLPFSGAVGEPVSLGLSHPRHASGGAHRFQTCTSLLLGLRGEGEGAVGLERPLPGWRTEPDHIPWVCRHFLPLIVGTERCGHSASLAAWWPSFALTLPRASDAERRAPQREGGFAEIRAHRRPGPHEPGSAPGRRPRTHRAERRRQVDAALDPRERGRPE